MQDNLAEVYRKLANIEEEIWGKIIIMERNSRIVKAYLRSRIITIDGSDWDFDGSRYIVQNFIGFPLLLLCLFVVAFHQFQIALSL